MSSSVSGWVPAPFWGKLKASVPIACVDIIVSEPTGAVLLGWRVIRPYVNVWALPGGRIRIGENLAKAARRILSCHALTASDFYLVGIYPIKFPSRFDISICLAASSFSGAPKADGIEFKKIGWFRNVPKETGVNYVKMIAKWRKIRASSEIVKLNLL